MEVMKNLEDFAVGALPTLYYIPDFVTEIEQDRLLNNIYQAPAVKWKSLKNRRLQNWGGVVHEKGLLAQELPPWMTSITQKITEASGLFPTAINHVLINEYLPNQGIMPHQDGPAYFPVVAILSLGSPAVMDFSPHSALTTFTDPSENSKVDHVSDSRPPDDNLPESFNAFSVVLMPRSLLIFKDKAYSDYLHGIKDSPVQRCDGALNSGQILKYREANQAIAAGSKESYEPVVEDFNSIHRTTKRISLTCRVVPKVNRKLFRF